MADDDRLYWRCRRGMLELDLLLQPFLEKGFNGLSPREQDVFRELLDLPDAQLFDLFFGSEGSRDGELARVIDAVHRTAAD